MFENSRPSSFQEISPTKVTICVTLELSNPRHQFHNVIVIKDDNREYMIRVKEVNITGDEEDGEEHLYFTPKEVTLVRRGGR